MVGVYRDDDGCPACPGLSMPFVPLAALMFLLGDVFDGHRQQHDPDVSNVVVRSSKGSKLTQIRVLCLDTGVVILAQLTHQCSALIKGVMRAPLDDQHTRYGVCGRCMVSSMAFTSHAGDTWVDRLLRPMGKVGVGLLMLSSVYSCVHAHLPQEQWAGRRWVTRSYTFKGRDLYVLSVTPRSSGEIPDGSGA